MGIGRVCVKASRAFGPRRLHTNTVYIDFARWWWWWRGSGPEHLLLDLGASDPGTVGGEGEEGGAPHTLSIAGGGGEGGRERGWSS